ncbi:MAG: SdrD B-like domain-containing protein [Clostridia bacterium]
MGSGLISYAADEQNQITFNAQILDSEGKEVKEADITSELNLHLSIAVKEGNLKNVNLDLSNCNFKLKDESGIDQINAGETKELDFKIVARNDDQFKLDLLNMESKIKLTGTYSNDNKTEEVNKEKTVSVKWNAQELYNMDDETRKATKVLENEIITNKTYTIDGEEKRVVQVKIKSGIKDNIYPIEKTQITANLLESGKMEEGKFVAENELKAEKVEVVAYSTKATNGKDGSANFGKIEENKLGSWEYDSESGKITITVNNSKDENNCVAWAKNAVDEFVITYIYNEESVKNVNAFRTVVESNLKLYTDEGEHKKTVRYWVTNTEKAMPIELNIQAPESLSKRNIQKGESFAEAWTLNISNTQIGGDILAVSKIDKLNIADSEDIKPVTHYNATYINKEDFINILGENGEIVILNMATGEELGKITKESTIENNDKILGISYSENASQIGVQISKPVKAGKLSIASRKTLNISSVEEYVSKIDKIDSLTINAIAGIQKAGEEDFIYSTETISKQISLVSPKSNAELGINLGKDKETLPVGEENKVDFTVTLHTSKETDKLFNNPTVQIELPEQVKEASIVENTEGISNANGLELNGITINNNIIEVKLTGNQGEYVDYNGQDTTITFSANLKTPELQPTTTGDIKLTVVNGEEKIEDSKQVTFSAEKGIILANSISNYNGEEPEILAIKENSKTGLLSEEKSAIAQVKGTIINNTEKDVENVVVVGNFAGEGSTITPILKEQIAVENATVEYSADGQTWEAYNAEKASTYKNYKITFAKLADKSITTFTYKIEIPENLGANKSMNSTYAIKIEDKAQKAATITLETPQKIEIEVSAKAISDTIYEEQEVTFTVDVTNKSNVTAKNVSLEASLPEELELVSKPENFDIEAGKTVTKTITSKVKALPEETKQKDITTTIKAIPNGKEDQAKTVEVKNVVKQALIKATIEDAYSDGAEFIYEGGQLGYKTTITNVSDETLTNVVITSKLPEGTKLNTKEIGVYKYEATEDPDMMKVEKIDIDIKESEKNGSIIYIIPKLEKGQTINIEIKMKADKLDKNVYEKEISYNEVISINEMEDYTLRKDDIVIKPNYEISFSSENLTDSSRNTYVNPGDEISYTLNIKNKTRFTQDIEINISEITGLKQLTKVEEAISIGNSYAIKKEIKPEEAYRLDIKGIANDAKEEDSIINFKAIISQIIQDREGISETREIVLKEETTEYRIKGTKTDEPDKPVDPDKPDTPTDKTYSISGTAWLDENEDGIKDEKEKLLKGILVKIKQINKDNVAEYLKGEGGKEITAITDNDGKYEFKELKAGKYIIEFEYNTKTYKLTPVTNKDSVPTAPTTSEGTTVKTDTLDVINENIENINIGLVLNSKFDLELNKYITKVTVQNNSGTTEYNYKNEQLAKVEIKAKQMASSTVLVEYQIEVKNNGAVPGTATVIADYLPKGLKFNSEMNTNWYQGTDGNLYTEELKDIMLEPGESKQVKLVLTKAMTSNSTGTFTNAAEIYEDKNDFGLVDTNSTPANKEQKENDYSTAELIISTATGSPMMYIGIIIISMLILGGGIYLINKKVILEKNI